MHINNQWESPRKTTVVKSLSHNFIAVPGLIYIQVGKMSNQFH